MSQLHQRVVVVELGDELVAPPVVSAPVVPDGELVLPGVEPPLLPGPPIELVLPLLLGDELPLLLVLVSELLLPLEPLGLVLAVLGLVGEVVLDELVEPVPLAPAPVVASRLLHALSESAATTAKDAAAHCVNDIFIRNS